MAHLVATFDPSACSTCTLFSYCRDELRRSDDPDHLLIEIGVPRDQRQHVVGLLHGGEATAAAPATLIGNVIATRDGVAARTDQLRVDPIGLPGTINVVLVKSDAAALGVHGISLQRIGVDGPGEWSSYVFDDPQSPDTRSDIIKILGKEINAAMAGQRKAAPDDPGPIHLVVPDGPTGDLLVSIADNLAGLELNRLRWEQDKVMGRPQLTYNGDPAIVPPRLSEKERTAVSFLLEEDRARAFKLRSPIVNAQAVLTRHLVTGGAPYNALRLDYLLAWAQPGGAIDHRQLTDEVEELEHTPGARMTSAMSNAIHQALVGIERTKGPRTGAVDPDRYQALVLEELRYKSDVLDGTIEQLADFRRLQPPARLRGDRGGRPGGVAATAVAARLRPRPLRTHLPELAQQPRAADRTGRQVPRPAAGARQPDGRPRHGGRRRHPRPLLRDRPVRRPGRARHGLAAHRRRVPDRAAAPARRRLRRGPERRA